MKKIIIIIGLLLLASSASATDWWDSSYQYRIPITVTGDASGSQTNYQLMLNVSYDSNMQSDFDDIRFTDDSGNLQNAWLEDKTDSSWADIWVNFTDTPDNGATQTYYMYYGNSEVSDYWNITTTFLFGDDFIGDSLDTDKWSDHQGETISNSELTLDVGGESDSSDVDHVFASSIDIDSDVILRIREKDATNDISRFGMGEDYYNILGSGEDCITIQKYSDGNLYTDCGIGTSKTQDSIGSYDANYHVYEMRWRADEVKFYEDDSLLDTITTNVPSSTLHSFIRDVSVTDWIFISKYAANPPTYEFDSEEEYTLPAASETPTPTPTPIPEIVASNYVIQNQTLYITQPCNLQYKITSNSFVYGGLRNINTVIADNNNTVISGWFKISTDQSYDADYTFFINVNDTSYESKIVTLKQEQVDSSIISKTYKRSLLIDGYEIYSYNTTVYIISIIPNPIYFYFNLEDRTIQFGDKQFNNQTLVFNQLNFDDQYEFMNNASSDTVVMKFKAINPSVKSGAELKGLTGILLNALSKIPFIGKSFKNVLYYPLFFIQTIFDFVFTFLDMIVNDWWYGLMLMEIVCIFAASRNKGYANVMEVYIDTHVKIIKFIYEWIILKTINLIITIVVTIKDMIKWW